MKKLLAMLLVLVMLCAGAVSLADTPLIGVCIPDLNTTLYELEGQAIRAIFPDYTVQVADAGNNVSMQVQQIQNFITMGAEMIVIVPTEVEAIADAMEEARSHGIKVVLSGVTADIGDVYDAVTFSDEYLIGCYVAMLGKMWAEDNHADNPAFETVIFTSTLNDDAITRTTGIQSIYDPYLKNIDGVYIDEHGEVVDEANRVNNPAYSELVATNPIYEVEIGLDMDGRTAMAAVLAEHPNVRLVLNYMSMNSTTASQYILDTYDEEEWPEFGIFSGGVLGDEADYMVGSVSETDGYRSVFRGAVAFGGNDAAQGLADLSYKVFNGEEGVDYYRRNAETIGIWITRQAEFGFPAKVICYSIFNENAVRTLDIMAVMNDENTTVYWDSDNGFSPEAAAEAPVAEAPAEYDYHFVESAMGGAFTVDFYISLADDGSYTITEANDTMGTTVYTGSSYTMDGDTLTTGPIENGKTPQAGWFNDDLSCDWTIDGDTATPVNYTE